MPALSGQFQFDPNAFNAANTNLGTAFSAAQNAVSPQSRDTAAARVRSRLAGSNQATVNAINESGTRNVGQTNNLLDSQRRASQNALATGLADVEKNFQDARLGQAGILGQIAGAQGGLQGQIGQIGVASNAQRANEDIGLRNAATNLFGAETNRLRANNDFTLGQGGLDVQRQQVEEDTRRNKQNELIAAFQQFAASGATESESPAFNRRFQDLISQLFGTQGLNAGAPDPSSAITGTPAVPLAPTQVVGNAPRFTRPAVQQPQPPVGTRGGSFSAPTGLPFI